MSTRPSYEFGPFRLEPAEQLLLRVGKPTPLTPKAFDLLVLLVQNQGRLVVKDEIMEAVWPGSFVEDANLTVLVSSLRKVLGDKDEGLKYIETVPKRGYRFTASVKVLEAPDTAAQPLPKSSDVSPVESGAALRAPVWGRRAAMLALIAVLCLMTATGYLMYRNSTSPATETRRSLAILPLRNLRHDPDSDFLGFSLADAIITRLDAVSSLSVRPSSAIEKYKGQEVDIRKVAADLKVNTLLTGNFLREDDNLRITYQLIDVNSYKILSKDMIDLKFDELLAVQDKVVQQVIHGLELNLSTTEAQRMKPNEPVNPLAYEYYLRGVDLMAAHEFPMAIKMLEQSAEHDPNYALTWAYLGQSYTSDATFEFGGREQYRRARVAYERALALQPKLVEAQMFLANLLIDTGKVEQAVPLLRAALAANPKNAAVHWEMGYAYRFAGMLNESVAECKTAREIDPLVKGNGAQLNAYLYLGEYDKFLRSLPDGGNAPFPLFYRGFGKYHQRKLDEAAKDFDRAFQLDPTLYTQIGKAFSDSITGKTVDGLELLRQAENKIQQRGVGDPEATYKIGQGYAVLGDNVSAVRMLRYSVDNGFFAYPYFIRDPLLSKIRDLPEFPHLMEAAQRRYELFKKRFF